jgi:glucosamine-6-phosphate deaminase
MNTSFKAGKLNVEIFQTRLQIGQEAAKAVGIQIRLLLLKQNVVNIIFAAAPSQNEFLMELQKQAIEWSKVNAFHMDEYVGLPADAPQGFGNFLKERLFSALPFKAVYYLNGNAGDLDAECDRYATLLIEFPADIVCMGIGENTHIAFNDPHVADFNDDKLVKVVDLDMACRQQQVNDGCFDAINEVPEYALTLTIPALTRPKYIYCMVPGEKKAQAVAYTINEEVNARHPSTILRTHDHATLYVDADSSRLIVD